MKIKGTYSHTNSQTEHPAEFYRIIKKMPQVVTRHTLLSRVTSMLHISRSLCAFVVLCILIAPSALAAPSVDSKGFYSGKTPPPVPIQNIDISKSSQASAALNNFLKCADTQACWIAYYDEINTALSNRVGIYVHGLHGPLWDPCYTIKHNLQPGSMSCHAIAFEFKADKVVSYKTRGSSHHSKCDVRISDYKGVAVLTYEDISKEFSIRGFVPQEFVSFYNCHDRRHEPGEDFVADCGKDADGAISFEIKYNKDFHSALSLLTIDIPEPATCNGNYDYPSVDPPNFPDDLHVFINPEVIKRGLHSGKSVGDSILHDRSEPPHLFEENKGYFSIIFK